MAATAPTLAAQEPGAALTGPGPWSGSHLSSGPSDAGDPEGMRRQLILDWERQRAIVLSYVEAMPEEGLDFRPTPDVRTFAEQIEHIVEDNVAIALTAFDRDEAPSLGAPEAYLESREALVEHVETGYDYVLGLLEDTPAEGLMKEGEVFGRYRVPLWRALAGAHEHATWTLGQTVPYLRMNGVEPPFYEVFRRDP